MSDREGMERYLRTASREARHAPVPRSQQDARRDWLRDLDVLEQECRTLVGDLRQATSRYQGTLDRFDRFRPGSIVRAPAVLLAVAAGFLAIAGALLTLVFS